MYIFFILTFKVKHLEKKEKEREYRYETSSAID